MKTILLVMLLTTILYCQAKNEIFIPPTLVIGSETSSNSDYLLEYPGFVETDLESNIYIVEKAELNIKVYDKKGKFLRRIGRRGRGPGEFLDISLLKINSANEIMVFDNFSYKITYFNLSGKYLREITYFPSEMNWPRRIVESSNHEYLLSYYLDTNKGLIFLWDKDFKKSKSTINYTELEQAKLSDLEREFVNFYGNLMASKGNCLVIAPYYFNSKLFSFKLNNSSIEYEKTFVGHVTHDKAYSTLKNSTKYDLEMFAQKGKFGANIQNTSVGLFIMNNGNLIHFTNMEDKGYMYLGYETYTSDFKSLGYFVLGKQKISEKNRKELLFGRKIACKDKDDNFYLIDETEYPKVVQFKIK